MPSFIQFTAAADSDQRIYKNLSLPAGSYIVFDKGYNNYSQFAAFTQNDIYFISRQKDNAVFKDIIECLHDETSPDNILKEAVVELQYKDENDMNKRCASDALRGGMKKNNAVLNLLQTTLIWMQPPLPYCINIVGKLNCF